MDLVAIGLKLKGLEIVPSAFDGFAQAPLSSRGACATAFVLYLVVLAVVKSAGLSPMRLRSLFFVHNALLSLASAALLAAFISQLAPMLLESGIDFAICSPRAFTRTLEWLYYLNYLFKYYELLDTVFLALKGKPTPFLHVYHHASVMALCFFELEGYASVQWVPITINLFVHVVMYYYYALSAIGIRVWWKKYLTSLQIAQFVVDLVTIFYASFVLVSSSSEPGAVVVRKLFGISKGEEPCHGTVTAAFVGCFVITSYLVLFIRFFAQTYKTDPTKSSESKTPLRRSKRKVKKT
ncbi:MAG: hypothetical protein SGCHY_002717 [Lobulomycetales sp.]